MARYKWIDTSPRFLAVDLAKQLLPGSFEHAVHHLVENEIDLGGFAARYRNDQNGALAECSVLCRRWLPPVLAHRRWSHRLQVG